MTQRHVYENGAWKDYTLTYDPENHLTNVTGAATAQFTYNGDGQRVKSVEKGTTKVYIGNYFEWSGSVDTMKRYYYAGSTRIAMRTGSGDPLWLLGDHLGSTNKAANYDGTTHGTQNYKAWGEARFVAGDIPTDFKFTGQREDYYIKLYWYESRWYDPELGRFLSPDSIVPGVGEGGNPNAVGYLGASTYSPLTVDFHENQFLDQVNLENRTRLQNPDFKLPPVPTNSVAFDRYSYSLNNSIRYSDPTGHCPFCVVLAAITPVGWVAIVITVAAAVVYFAVPGVRESVESGMYQAGEANRTV
jgi:RHS repeat-associated protein